jgi:hypothetical protein
VATTRTARKCPWCGTGVRLALAPIVATNVEGSRHDDESGAIGGLGGGEFSYDDDFTFGLDDLEEDVLEESEAEPEPVLQRPVPVSGATPLGYAGELPIVAGPQVDAATESFVQRRMAKRLLPVADQADPRDLPARACTSCHRPLPADVDDREVLILAVLGINRAGKTYLLATALTEALQNGALEPAGITGFTAEESTANRFHRDYYLPVFRKRNRLDPTQDPAEGDSVEPLIFRFEVDGRPFLLALHDLAGEAVAEPRRRAVVAPFIRHADGIVFVVDPLEIETVRTQLPFEQVTVDWRGWSQLDVLRASIDTLAGDASKTPVSVVLTKSDLVGLAEQERFGFAKPAPADGWLEDQFAIDREVRALMRSWGAGQFEDATKAAARGFFHAVSAFGAPPADPSVPGVVSPVRVADPFGTLIRLIAEARAPK